MSMTREKFIQFITQLSVGKHESLRVGQHVFLSLHDVDPVFANHITEAVKECDPFYDDNRLPELFQYIMDRV